MSGFWNDYEKAVQEEGGSGGIVCQGSIETGYKVYVAGLEQEDTFFPAEPGDEKAKTKAKAKAKAKADKLAEDHGVDRGGRWGIQIRAFVDDAFSRGQPATWKTDRFFNTDSWTSACKEVVVTSLKQHGISLPWEGWFRIGFKPDPHFEAMGEDGKTDEDQSGKSRFPQVAYVTEVFANEKDAMATLSTTSVAETPTGIPDGYDAKDWAETQDDIEKDVRAMFEDDESKGAVIKKMMGDYDIPRVYAKAIVESVEQEIPL